MIWISKVTKAVSTSRAFLYIPIEVGYVFWVIFTKDPIPLVIITIYVIKNNIVIFRITLKSQTFRISSPPDNLCPEILKAKNRI